MNVASPATPSLISAAPTPGMVSNRCEEADGINTITFFFRYKDHFGTYDRMSVTDEISEQLGNQIFQLK